MVKKNTLYESPDISATRVELESSICNGSVDFKQVDNGAAIEAQKTNEDFKGGADGGYFNTAEQGTLSGWNDVDSSSES